MSGRPPSAGRVPRSAVLGALPCGAALVAAAGQPTAATAGLAAVLGGVFAVLALIDVETRRIPNAIVLPALALAACTSWAWPERGAAEGLAGAAVGLGVMAPAYALSRGGLGGGDVKMAALVGAAAGYPGALAALLVATASAAVAAAVLLVSRPEGRRATMPYGPFLALGGLAGLMW